MSNRAAIVTTKFINVKEGNNSVGFRVYDDYMQTYDNTWEDIPDNDMDVLKRVMGSDDNKIVDLFDSMRENKKGIEIDGTWYDWEEIKDIINIF